MDIIKTALAGIPGYLLPLLISLPFLTVYLFKRKPETIAIVCETITTAIVTYSINKLFAIYSIENFLILIFANVTLYAFMIFLTKKNKLIAVGYLILLFSFLIYYGIGVAYALNQSNINLYNKLMFMHFNYKYVLAAILIIMLIGSIIDTNGTRKRYRGSDVRTRINSCFNFMYNNCTAFVIGNCGRLRNSKKRNYNKHNKNKKMGG